MNTRVMRSLYVYASHGYFTYTENSGIAMAREVALGFGGGELSTYINDIVVEND